MKKKVMVMLSIMSAGLTWSPSSASALSSECRNLEFSTYVNEHFVIGPQKDRIVKESNSAAIWLTIRNGRAFDANGPQLGRNLISFRGLVLKNSGVVTDGGPFFETEEKETFRYANPGDPLASNYTDTQPRSDVTSCSIRADLITVKLPGVYQKLGEKPQNAHMEVRCGSPRRLILHGLSGSVLPRHRFACERIEAAVSVGRTKKFSIDSKTSEMKIFPGHAIMQKR